LFLGQSARSFRFKPSLLQRLNSFLERFFLLEQTGFLA
jgi:hypothetical protein